MPEKIPPFPDIRLNHAGFLCRSGKRAVFKSPLPPGAQTFELQDMIRNASEALGEFENWETVFTGPLEKASSQWGFGYTGDFSAWEKPGVYRVVLPGGAGRSRVFTIGDGVFSELPRMFLDYLHGNRCGPFENDWRGPCHLDDGILRSTGRQIDATGGWHDAGDTRKWMVHCVLPALALAAHRHEQPGTLRRNHWGEAPWNDDLLAELAWGVRFILKMQDPATGMIYEDVGGGGDARTRQGMTWWYENHAGCCADNADNRFTDNIPGSDDERIVRDRYNPIVQYTNIHILLAAVPLIEEHDPSLARQMREAATAAWRFMQDPVRVNDDFHTWTSVRAWRLLAALALLTDAPGSGPAVAGEVDVALERLLELRSPSTGFWFMGARKADYYRGILHSAQPLIALAAFAAALPGHPRKNEVRDTVRRCIENYVEPLRRMSPFGIVPYGAFPHPATPGDHYRQWKDNAWFRFFMPANSPQKVNHGLAGHWTSWAHALALCAGVFDLPECRAAAFDQLYWLLGNNPADVSMLSGFGYNNLTPHSRAFGFMPGGLMLGPRGDAADEPFFDTGGFADWSCCEYWTTGIANAWLALARLLPRHIPTRSKLGMP